VTAVCRVLAGLPRRSSLVVVDDGSTDGTAEVLTGLAGQPFLMVVTHPVNAGYGAALRTGVETAAAEGYDYVLFMDSDLTNAPADIPRFLERMDEGVDVIKATRYSGGGGVDGVPFWRWAISAAGNRLARLLFRLPIADCTNGFRAVKVSVLRRMRLTENRFPVIMEELDWCTHLARTYAEVPVRLTNRDAGQRRTSFTYTPAVFARYLEYPIRSFLGIKPKGWPAGDGVSGS
jgi:glycosyltransferase involved in cell wall biosynthesis